MVHYMYKPYSIGVHGMPCMMVFYGNLRSDEQVKEKMDSNLTKCSLSIIAKAIFENRINLILKS